MKQYCYVIKTCLTWVYNVWLNTVINNIGYWYKTYFLKTNNGAGRRGCCGLEKFMEISTILCIIA